MTGVVVGSLPAAAVADPGLGGTSGRPKLALSWAELAEYARDAARSGGCTRPVRIKGRLDAIDLATGERRLMYDTATEPGGVLLMPCGNRRESVCPPCSQVYKQDARQLVRAGLTGGKGIRRPWPGTRACSRPSPPRPSARCTHGECAARPCCRAGRAGITKNAAARTAGTSPVHAATTRTTPGSVGLSAPTAMTMGLPSSSTPTRAGCGAGSPPISPGTWRAGGAHPAATARPGPGPLRQGGRIPGTWRRALPRRHPPRRSWRGLPAPS